MESKEQIALEALYTVLDELNEERPADTQLAKARETGLYGPEGSLDSIDLVRLVVIYEQQIQEVSDLVVSINDERAMSEENSQFKTVGSLAAHVARLMEEASA